MEQIFLFSSIAGLIAIIYGFATAKQVLNMPSGDKKMVSIAGAIRKEHLLILKGNILQFLLLDNYFIFFSIFLDLNIAIGF